MSDKLVYIVTLSGSGMHYGETQLRGVFGTKDEAMAGARKIIALGKASGGTEVDVSEVELGALRAHSDDDLIETFVFTANVDDEVST